MVVVLLVMWHFQRMMLLLLLHVRLRHLANEVHWLPLLDNLNTLLDKRVGLVDSLLDEFVHRDLDLLDHLMELWAEFLLDQLSVVHLWNLDNLLVVKGRRDLYDVLLVLDLLRHLGTSLNMIYVE